MAVWLPTTVALESSLLRPSTPRPEAHAPVGTGRALRSRGRVASGLGVGTALSLVLLPQQSSNSKKDKDALEDRKRNPLLRYIGKPRSSSQSSESMGTAAGWGHSPAGPLRDRRPRQPQPSSGGPSSCLEQRPPGRAGTANGGGLDLRVGLCAEGLCVGIRGVQQNKAWGPEAPGATRSRLHGARGVAVHSSGSCRWPSPPAPVLVLGVCEGPGGHSWSALVWATTVRFPA